MKYKVINNELVETYNIKVGDICTLVEKLTLDLGWFYNENWLYDGSWCLCFSDVELVSGGGEDTPSLPMTEQRWNEIVSTLTPMFDCDKDRDVIIKPFNINNITEEECKLIISVLKNNTPF